DPDKMVIQHIGITVQPRIPVAERNGVTFVGRLVDKKGVGDLIEAYSRLPEALRRDTPLRIVGAGPRERDLRHRARELGVEAHWLGYRPTREVTRLLATSEVFCAPSRRA